MSFRRAARKDANHNEITDCFISLGWWDLEGVNEIDHDDIIKALKEQGE